ncbi:MAG: DUF882 domain-containing protein [gamma proteobacterium symbiont of Bathyaustriella thionipta]|nr:DUF882 domain-containing protein [gamma proteobacterium symbiont of Bathyaustriella thionipta]MCU7949917.1 DUF882 domain-containing protein [gamma proteobacterium symbiont of Bathyaustriella thionipta]MCU7954181.1 DUF882 domain-containing protein [gamma proteobacterium symbiont of Bathyaustriella thionipta]MCU7956469.1 DUF882 domain-containing protein [gamma proteobacterium symbiont of Bathyaustriella thionipta]MCU7967461.1 DUF882 domain-containing protein [gamma proteobacterium symbiont of 
MLNSYRIFTIGTLTLPFSATSFAKKMSSESQRELSFYHTHTGNNLSIIYHDGESHLTPALNKINQFLGDFRTGDIHDIDIRLLDALYLLQQQTGVEQHFEVISGYRSPKTNAKLRGKSNGVAKRSLHMQGKAIDIRLKGVDTKILRDTAIAMKVGGVGYYRRSDFIHLDTGRVRYW